MPSSEHELLIDMFWERPELTIDVLEVLNFPIPDYDEVVVLPGDLTAVTPTEYRADRVVVCKVWGKPTLAVIIEVQLGTDKRKRFSWPAYVANLYSRLECPVLLLVMCLDTTIANWCRKPVVITHSSFFRMAPAVMGPRQIPVVTDVALAERAPELAVLSVATHHSQPEPRPMFEAFLAGLGKVKEDRANLYYDYALASLPEAARALLEELVTTTGYRYQSDFARRYFSAGKSEGMAEGEARALLMVLAARGVDVPDEAHDRITACTDVDQLDAWAHRAATADNIGDLFD